MTGGEIVPIANAARKVVSEDMTEKQLLAELAKDHPAAVEAADRWAKRLAIKQGILYKLYSPLAKWAGTSKGYFENDFAKDMSEKIADIPDDHLSSPKPSVAMPAMEALGFSLDEPELKDMFLNLLATATDGRVQDQAHPSFAHIIQQLSAAEAGLLRKLLPGALRPIAHIHKRSDDGKGYHILATNVMNLKDASGQPVSSPSVPVWADNWVRLGLIEIDFQTSITAADAYDWVTERPEYKQCITKFQTVPEQMDINKGVFRRTDFGSRFMDAVFTKPSRVPTV